MEKVVCFGAGGGVIKLKNEIKKQFKIIGYTDNDNQRWGEYIDNIKIFSPDEAIRLDYDYIVITSIPGLEPIRQQLLKMGITKGKIITSYVELPIEARKTFLKSLSLFDLVYPKEASCAEVGVFEGEFAKYINEYFPSRRLHLFDTFEGFDQRDIDRENNKNKRKQKGVYGNTSVDLVMNKMMYPYNVYIHKGYFPDTVYGGGTSEKYCFVNLDLDLYLPTYEGLMYFSKRMVKKGVILVHDYFAETFDGPRRAVDEFLEKDNMRLNILPIGDGLSVAIVGF